MNRNRSITMRNTRRARCHNKQIFRLVNKINELVEWSNSTDKYINLLYDIIIDMKKSKLPEPLYHVDGLPVYDCAGCPYYTPDMVDDCAIHIHNADGTCELCLMRKQFEIFSEYSNL